MITGGGKRSAQESRFGTGWLTAAKDAFGPSIGSRQDRLNSAGRNHMTRFDYLATVQV